MPEQVCLHESGERGSHTVSGAEAGLFTATGGLFESLPGSLLAPAATHSAVRTPDTCDGQILNRMRGVGLCMGRTSNNMIEQKIEDNRRSVSYQKIKTRKRCAVLGLKRRVDDDALK